MIDLIADCPRFRLPLYRPLAVSTMGDISVRCGAHPEEAAPRRTNAAIEFDKQCGTCDA